MTMMQGLSLTGVPVSASAKKRGEYWLQDCLSLVKVMHRVISRLYGGLETDAVYDIDFEDDKETLTLDGDSWKLSSIYSDNCYKIIKKMTDPTNGPVEFPLSQIITILRRCLCLSYTDVLAVPSRIDLATLLPHLHQCSMDVLSQLILCCGRDMLHHSHIIIDLCLQTLVSTAKMPDDSKYRTRSSTYQALMLWVKTCGWGKYLSTHRKFLIQELIADTQADEEEGLAKKNESDESKAKHERFSGRKGKRKKGQRGDSYMELETKENDKAKDQNIEAREDLVLLAFSLSQLAIESLPFSLSQTLISHLIKTASTVQRLSLNRPQPYSRLEARKGLYQVVAGCLLSSLESSGNHIDTVTHYQLTNAALDILVRACHADHSQIQTVCSQALATLKSSSNLKGPVIRKVLDYDDNNVEDVSQLMRENEQQSDRIEDLRQKLMNSEMENEQQLRLISSLREQITTLQTKVPTTGTQESMSSINIAESRLSDDEKNEANSDDDNDDAQDDSNSNPEDATNSPSIKDEGEMQTGDCKTAEQHYSQIDSGPLGKEKSMPEEKLKSSQVVKTDPSGCNEDLEKKNNNDFNTTSTKRPNDNQNTSSKRLKVDDEKEKASNGIEDMLMDFVDAPPDS